MSEQTTDALTFDALNLLEPVLKAIKAIGYETPTPIQAETIPHILEGKDVLGMAQTGTGKTAAFALPLLSRIDPKLNKPQALVLAPTRELAIQVAEAFQQYASKLRNFHVLPIYGGQDYRGQLRQLKRGVHVVVGTPGRVMDHMRKGTLELDELKCLVLDEADEMLRMGFQDDVEWILTQTPEEHQTTLFSATMPKEIRKIAKDHLNSPEEITIKVKTTTASTIRQRYWTVSGFHKLDALTRILEAEPFDGMIIFVRTKQATVELADKLAARGFSAAALNGDIAQASREKIVDRLKAGKLDILVATDVVARGLDVERVSHVINYDIPYDTEAYVHRIGRTGRAGRHGDAILFVAPREQRLLKAIERATKQKIELMDMPTTEVINDKRINNFKQRITDTLAQDEKELNFFQELVEQYQNEHNIPAVEVAAALAKLVQGDEPLLLKNKPVKEPRERRERGERGDRNERRDRRKSKGGEPEAGMETFRIEVGYMHGVKPGNIVGAIANEAGLDSQFIGRIDIGDEYSTVDLPEGMPRETMNGLRKVWVAGQQLQIAKLNGPRPEGKGGAGKGKGRGKPSGKSGGGSRRSGKPNSGSSNRKDGGNRKDAPRRRPRKSED